MAVASHFHGGVQCDQEVEDHDPDWQGDLVVVVPVDNEVIVVVAIAIGIRGGGGRKELAVVNNLLLAADAAAVGGQLEHGNARLNRDATEPLLLTTLSAMSATSEVKPCPLLPFYYDNSPW